MKRLIFSSIFSFIALLSFASDGYKIQVSVSDMKNEEIYLVSYIDGKPYGKDTTNLNAKGVGIFSKKEKLPQGIYMIYFNPNKHFDILVGADQDIRIKTDTTNLKVNVSGAVESIKFQEFVELMKEKHKELTEHNKKYKDGKIDSLTFRKEFEKLNKEVTAYQERAIEENKGTFFSVFVKGAVDVEIPEYNELPDSTRYMARYQYAKKHYFDNINLSDPRFIRTPYFPPKVDNFIGKIAIQAPDSLIQIAFDLIEKSKDNDTTFQTMTSRMINYAITSPMMGMDAVWLAIADRYYFSGKATWVKDTTWVNNLKREAKKIRHNLIGMQAHNLAARDSNNHIVQLKDIKKDFVLVYFYEPSCGHCKKVTPALHDSVYTKWKNQGFEVYAFYTQQDRKEWLDFIHQHKFTDWINVWDPDRETYFWEFYDVSSTPGMYLLDMTRDRKIIAKKIDTKTLDKILNEEINVRRKKKE